MGISTERGFERTSDELIVWSHNLDTQHPVEMGAEVDQSSGPANRNCINSESYNIVYINN